MFTDKSTFLRVTVLTGAGVGLLLCTFAAADPPEYRRAAVFNPGGNDPYGMALGLINRDARLDLVVANQSDSSITVFLNTGDWTGDPPVNGFRDYDDPDPGLTIKYNLPENVIEPFVALGDFNSDNKLDIVVVLRPVGKYAIYFNDGTGGFGTPTVYPLASGEVSYTPRGVGVGDFDNDGKQDIALATERSEHPTVSVALVVAWGDGTGEFTNTEHVSNSGGMPHELVVADVDGIPGRLDVVMSDQQEFRFHVCINNGGRNFSLTWEPAVASKGITAYAPTGLARLGADVALTDLNGRMVRFFRNDGSGDFQLFWTYDFVNYILPMGIATGKLNMDSLPDFVTANAHLPEDHGGVSVFVGTGLPEPDPPFDGPFNFSSGEDEVPKPQRVVVGDVNNDGMDDIVTSNFFGNSVSVLIQKVPE